MRYKMEYIKLQHPIFWMGFVKGKFTKKKFVEYQAKYRSWCRADDGRTVRRITNNITKHFDEVQIVGGFSIYSYKEFTKEQEMKKEKKRKEDMLEREKIKKYFVDLKILKQLNDEGFDNYVNDKFDRLKDIKTSNDIKLRKENFIFNIFKDIEKDRKKSKKFNFISPVKFSNHNYNYY